VFFPDEKMISHPGNLHLSYEDVTFKTEDRLLLHGWFFPAGHGVPIVLFCHGNAGNISHRLEHVRLLVKNNIPVFIFDYRGYGRSQGKPSEEGIYRDGVAAYDYLLKQRRCGPDRIVLFGRSLGASVAIEVASRRRSRSLILECPFTSAKEMAGAILIFRPFSVLVPSNYNNLAKIEAVSVPKLIIHGDKDTLVPFSMGESLFQKARPPKYFLPVPGADHNDVFVIGGKTYVESFSAFVRNSRI
jgi:fermentation-respiration switch protein FrsA (DUF1100 family)